MVASQPLTLKKSLSFDSFSRFFLASFLMIEEYLKCRYFQEPAISSAITKSAIPTNSLCEEIF